MLKDGVKFTFLGMDPSEALKEYALGKILKREDLLRRATSVEVAFKQSKSSKGVQDDFRVDIAVDLPELPIRVEERGEDMYANVDLAVDTLVRRLTRYADMKEHWSGEKGWKSEDTDRDGEEHDDYIDYVPKVTRRKKIEDMSPLEEGEAIERMEMLGYDFFLFRNKSTDKVSAIYRRKNGTYGIVEPA